MSREATRTPALQSTAPAMRQELAAFGRPVGESELQGDDRLFRALVSGCHIENAAVAAGVSERTAYRRLADPEFRRRIDEARQALRESILAKLADAGHDAIGVLTELMQGAEDEGTRLKAAKAVLDSLTSFQRNEKQISHGKPASQQPALGRIILTLPDDGRESLDAAGTRFPPTFAVYLSESVATESNSLPSDEYDSN